jgi:hypothetical protein
VNDELRVHSFGFGPNRDGVPSVSFTVTLPSGLEGSFGWEEEAEDIAERERILASYEPRILEKLASVQGFVPTAIDFKADKP